MQAEAYAGLPVPCVGQGARRLHVDVPSGEVPHSVGRLPLARLAPQDDRVQPARQHGHRVSQRSCMHCSAAGACVVAKCCAQSAHGPRRAGQPRPETLDKPAEQQCCSSRPVSCCRLLPLEPGVAVRLHALQPVLVSGCTPEGVQAPAQHGLRGLGAPVHGALEVHRRVGTADGGQRQEGLQLVPPAHQQRVSPAACA